MSILLDVVLFLREQGKHLKLSPIQKLILFTFAGRIGKNQNCWIKQSELAEECDLSLRGFITNLNTLVDHKIIIIDKLITKKGKQNIYKFSEDWNTYMHHNAHSMESTTCTPVHIEGGTMCTGVHNPTCTPVHVPPPKKSPETVDTPAIQDFQISVKETIEINNKAKEQSLVYFDEFWNEYPRKDDKKNAIKKWSSLKCDKFADEIIRNVKARNATSWKGKEKQFILLPTTYLNGKRWKDEVELTTYEIGQKHKSYTRAQNSVLGHLDWLNKH